MTQRTVWFGSACVVWASAYACSSPDASPPRAALPDPTSTVVAPTRPGPTSIPLMLGPSGGMGSTPNMPVPPPPAAGGTVNLLGSTRDLSGYNTGEQGCNPENGCAGSMIAGDPGTVLRELWMDVPKAGYPNNTSAVAAFTSRAYSPDFPDHPSFTDQLIAGLQAYAPDQPLKPRNWDDNYGQRIRGFIKAPETGLYVFWLDSDNASQLWLSLSTPDKAQPIAAVDDYSPANSFLLPGQRSAPIPMTAGKLYYIDIFHKEGGADDFCEVRWTKPSDPQGMPGHTYQVVPPTVLYTAVPGVDPGPTGGTGGMAAAGGADSAGGSPSGGAPSGGTMAGGSFSGGAPASGGASGAINSGGTSASGGEGAGGANNGSGAASGSAGISGGGASGQSGGSSSSG